jgi:hypothetical protein
MNLTLKIASPRAHVGQVYNVHGHNHLLVNCTITGPGCLITTEGVASNVALISLDEHAKCLGNPVAVKNIRNISPDEMLNIADGWPISLIGVVD